MSNRSRSNRSKRKSAESDRPKNSSSSTSANSWRPVEKRDTTPDVAARQREWWLGLSGGERLTWMFDFVHEHNTARYEAIRRRNPEASAAELTALWTEETYRDRLPADFLARALAAIRERGASLAGDSP